MFGIIYLFAVVATTNVLPFTQNPRCITAKILHHTEMLWLLANFTLNTLQPLSIFHAQSNNKVFTLKEAMQQEEKLEFVKSTEK